MVSPAIQGRAMGEPSDLKVIQGSRLRRTQNDELDSRKISELKYV